MYKKRKHKNRKKLSIPKLSCGLSRKEYETFVSQIQPSQTKVDVVAEYVKK